ncbi:MAG: glutamine-hydrolyzing carbamoyl-phosphate synthase small subunit [Chloroflexi bacterium]|nr:glutamine-hydrolyzing carbamoyl-phosphate synthase small subunit [Chloroflexota bacterium]
MPARSQAARLSAYLVLEDGSVYRGARLGADGEATGEVVFNTSMTGYQEMLTDPSYGGQILIPTYPLIGNYGVNDDDWESKRIQVRGFVVRSDCDLPSHRDSKSTIDEFLAENGIPGISGVDTRAITRKLRSHGVMMGLITAEEDVEYGLKQIGAAPRYGEFDVVTNVSTSEIYTWDGAGTAAGDGRPHVVVVDLGVKHNILRNLEKRGCRVTVTPMDVTAEQVMALEPDGVLLSPGPGDPVFLDSVVDLAKSLSDRVPMFGICLGHQVIARAFGAETFKLKFGHRGGNHSVMDDESGRVYVTAQNHGYAVSRDGLSDEMMVTHRDLSDDTVEGLRHKTLPIMTIQYHSEASPGPRDAEYLFDRFVEMVADAKRTPSASGRGDIWRTSSAQRNRQMPRFSPEDGTQRTELFDTRNLL